MSAQGHHAMHRMVHRLSEFPMPTAMQTVTADQFNDYVWAAFYEGKPFKTADLDVCKILQIGSVVYVCYY